MAGFSIVGKKSFRRLKEQADRNEQLNKFIKSFLANLLSEVPPTPAQGIDEEIFALCSQIKTSLASKFAEQRRSTWSNEGLAHLLTTINKSQHNVTALANEAVSHLARYTGSNYGALYLAEGATESDRYLRLEATFAVQSASRKGTRVERGEGMVGQCFQDGKTIVLDSVPQNYIKVSSGLGEATPTSVVLVPMISDFQVLGVMEFAGFDAFEKYTVDFLLHAAANVASIIHRRNTAEATEKLLAKAQQLSEQLIEREEQLRQKHEELALQKRREEELLAAQLKTQDEIHQRIVKRLQDKIANLMGKLEESQQKTVGFSEPVMKVNNL